MRKKGSVLIAIGLVLLAAALSLTLFNVWDAFRADKAAKQTVEALWELIPSQPPAEAPAQQTGSDGKPALPEPPKQETVPAVSAPETAEKPTDGTKQTEAAAIPEIQPELPLPITEPTVSPAETEPRPIAEAKPAVPETKPEPTAPIGNTEPEQTASKPEIVAPTSSNSEAQGVRETEKPTQPLVEPTEATVSSVPATEAAVSPVPAAEATVPSAPVKTGSGEAAWSSFVDFAERIAKKPPVEQFTGSVKGFFGSVLHSFDGIQLDLNVTEAAEQEEPIQTVDIGYYSYMGVLEVESMGLSLPVMDSWSYDRLKISPCRFSGSLSGNLVICGHNYWTHFYQIKYADEGTVVKLTDVTGTIHYYAVRKVEIMGPDDADRMIGGGWDLTLFTCTDGGEARAAVRCERI